MELFHRRYLCFFAFLFMLASVLAFSLEYEVKHGVMLLLFGLALVALGVMIFVKKHRFAIAVIFASLLFSFVAIFNSFAFISIPQSRAQKYIGDFEAAQVRILSLEYSDENSSEYLVRLERIGQDEPEIKAYLYCDFPSELDYGDKMISKFKISII